ncbi:MAG: S-methyl-5'-thioadenosine phosphorylase [archaeon]
MIGIIGGSGIYSLDVKKHKDVQVSTPFGKPSGKVRTGTIAGKKVAFIARHGDGHIHSPSNLNYRANIFALKKIGVTKILSVQAVGSLKEGIMPLDIVIPNQIIDRTRLRASTFFDKGIVTHVSFADPFCSELSGLLSGTSRQLGYQTHPNGTYLCMEGPQFSTRAESKMYQSWGASIIGMTAVPEAKLAREAEMCYASVATVTDYDVWKERMEDVSVEMIIENAKKNEAAVIRVLEAVIPKINADADCTCHHALAGAIMTDPKMVLKKVKADLRPLIGRYLK